MTEHSTLFDRCLYRMRRDRAAAHFADHDFLKHEATLRLADRIDDIARTFPLALDLGCHSGQMAETLGDRSKIGQLIQCDISANMLSATSGARVQCDEEWLPFADDSFDLVVSALSLHHVNDLPGTLVQIRRILKPDGLFLAILPGANSLLELRESLAAAEMAQYGGISPRISPFVEVRDAGNLLQRAGFTLPVVDSEPLTITYPHVIKLMHELRGMGESNILQDRHQRPLSRDFFAQLGAHYAQHFRDPATEKINATAEFITLTAWKAHESQQQPAKRGSGTVNLADFLT